MSKNNNGEPDEAEGYGAGIVLGLVISSAFWALLWWALQ